MKKFLFKLSLLTSAILSCSVAMAQQAVETAQVLPTIEVTAQQGTKYETNVVTTEVKNESTETDLRGLLKEEPAIEIGGGNGTSQYFAIRGMGQNSIDVKIDNSYSDAQILYHQGRFMLDPALVKIVEVQKGAGSASAGIGATNGAIVAKTVDALDLLQNSDRDYGFKIHGGYNSNDGHNYGASVFGKAGNFDGLLAYNKVDDNNYKAGKGYRPENDDVISNSALEKASYLAKVGATFGNHRIVLSHMNEQHDGYRAIRQEFDMGNALLLTDAQAGLNRLQRQAGLKTERTGRKVTVNQLDPITRQPLKDSNGKNLTHEVDELYVLRPDGTKVLRNEPSYTEINLQNTNLEWTATDLGLIEKATANAYLMKNQRWSADDTGNGYAGNLPGESETTITTKGANVNFDWKVGDTTTLKTGVNYRNQEIDPNRFLRNDITKPEKTDTGAYVEVISEIADTVTLTGGLRYDHFKFKAMDNKTVSDSAINPSVGIIWQVIPSLSLSANHNYATRSPRMYDALLTHGGRGITSIKEGTTAERARNTEVGFNFKHNLTDDSSLAFKGSYFWQRIDDAVVNSQTRHDDNQREITNVGYIKNKGYELDVAYKIYGLTARLGVAHSDPTFYGQPSNTAELNPEFGAKVGRTWTSSIAYRFNYPNLELGVRNRSVEKAKDALNANINTPQNRQSYSATDVFANWKPLDNDKLNVNFGINNITDENYRPHSQRANGGIPASGRDYRIGFNYTF